MRASEAMRRRVAGVRALSTGKGKAVAGRILQAILDQPVGETFTSEDLRRRIGESWKEHPNAWGAAFHHAAEKGLIVENGFRRGDRPESRARVLVVWVRK
jgi:hypothetical protein